MIPLGTLTVVTGVSGSGNPRWSTTCCTRLGAKRVGAVSRNFVTGWKAIRSPEVVIVDQSPIGAPAFESGQYLKAFDAIREVFAILRFERRGYGRSFFL